MKNKVLAVLTLVGVLSVTGTAFATTYSKSNPALFTFNFIAQAKTQPQTPPAPPKPSMPPRSRDMRGNPPQPPRSHDMKGNPPQPPRSHDMRGNPPEPPKFDNQRPPEMPKR